jgi:hypothetical protein
MRKLLEWRCLYLYSKQVYIRGEEILYSDAVIKHEILPVNRAEFDRRCLYDGVIHEDSSNFCYLTDNC